MSSLTPAAIEKLLSERLGTLGRDAIRREYEHEGVIFEEGTASDGLYLVLEGEVSFVKRMVDGKFRTVSYSRTGDFFGEIGVLTGHARSLKAVAVGHTVIVKIPGESLVEYLNEMPGPISNLLQSIIKHLHETTQTFMQDMLRQEKMAMIGAMMNTIIHDFKNPFCLISLSAQLIEQDHKDEKTRRYSKNITEQVSRMLEMAAEIAEFSKGQQTLRISHLDLHDVFAHFQALNSPYFQSSKVKISIEVPSMMVAGEEMKLQRVFQNLVGNAIEAIGDKPGNITITAVAENAHARITVADDGPGIPEEIRNHFWDAFVTRGKESGTGLGSAICKSIVESHGGTISFQTSSGKGTTFTLLLPLVESAPKRKPRAASKKPSALPH
ncbi:MAG: ATP-binding protein [Verrucomicrobiota bacterium]|nr:ATP-binding protein [Verrucomicrobiota bacterium]